MRLSLALALAVLAVPVGAETDPVPAGCDDLKAVAEAAMGLDLTARPTASSDGWCVLDAARSSGAALQVSAETLRLRGEAQGDRLVALEVEGAGLRVAPALNNRDMPGWLRDLLRLQSAELRLTLRRDDAGDVLWVERGDLSLSDGTRLSLTAMVAGAELNPTTLAAGRVNELHLQFRNRGRVFHPIMQALGESIRADTTGSAKTNFGRSELLRMVGSLQDGVVSEESGWRLRQFVRSLPEARGLLVVNFSSEGGIGAAQLGLLALAKDPTGPEALARLFGGAQVTVDWQPGIAP